MSLAATFSIMETLMKKATVKDQSYSIINTAQDHFEITQEGTQETTWKRAQERAWETAQERAWVIAKEGAWEMTQ